MKTTAWLTVVTLALSVSVAGAQESAESEEGEPKNVVGLFAGALSNLETDETGPAIGADYTREVHEKLGIVAMVEWASAGSREAAFGAGVAVEPGGGVKLVLAPGVIFEKTLEEEGSTERETLFVFRTGFGYKFEVSGVPLVPTINFDIVESEDGVDLHLVYGVSVEIPF